MTREEDLVRIAKKLDKMVSRNNMDGALDLLRELKEFNMTLKLLQNTRIGMSVNGIRKHCTDEQAVSLAKILIKNWKRLLESPQAHKEEKLHDRNNGVDSSSLPPSGNDCTPAKTMPEKERIPVKTMPEKERIPSKTMEEKERVPSRRWSSDPTEPHRKLSGDHRKQRHSGEQKREREKKERERKEAPDPNVLCHPLPLHLHPPPSPKRPAAELKKERKEAPDPNALCPPLPLHLHPPPPPKRPAAELKKERKEAPDPNALCPPLPLHLHPPPPPKRPAAELKKERKEAPDPNALCPPLPLHLHPPPPPKRPAAELKKERKEAPDPNALCPPLPLHLHPPPPPKRPAAELKKERTGKEAPDSTGPLPQHHHPPPPPRHSDLQKERKNSTDGKPAKRLSVENKKDRKDSSDFKALLHKRPSHDGRKDRKDSSDSRPSLITKRLSSDGKSDRKDSDLKPACSPPAKKLCGDRRDSLGSKSPHSGPLQRKPSDSSVSVKGKADPPKTPTSPTSPLTPPFSPVGGALPPHLLTGDSIRDKCIEMLSAALRTDDDYKVFGTNCDSMGAEIEDYIYQEVRATDLKYKNRVRSRISNLKDPKNPGLRKNVLAGAIELQRIASMTAEEMASDELKQLRNTMTQEAIREHQMAKTGGTTTDLLQCGKCRKKNCTYNQVQTRSADEPMTTFVLCNECGNRWKFC
ncbi:transcription elongation factor A protein 3 isoform X11 [Conger conger]|uniref:transcription elongation factor A protein 3 isoform X11 n=1 Tax=Conger conger TaxID=82655 RepID=UPI002A5AC948|nr:transcription elongation factor A protein 3 isoform X11 [Conger conger]